MLDYLIEFALLNKIGFKYQNCAIQKHFYVYKKEDMLKILKFLYKYHRKDYFKLNSFYKSTKALKNRIFINYYHEYSNEIKNYFIYWNE